MPFISRGFAKINDEPKTNSIDASPKIAPINNQAKERQIDSK